MEPQDSDASASLLPSSILSRRLRCTGGTDQRYKSYDLNLTDPLPAGDFFGKP